MDYRTTAGEAVVVRVGLSPTSAEAALRNLEAEAPAADFDGLRAKARATWRKALSAIAIEGATDKQRRVFTTALYHAFVAPTLFSDVDGGYRGLDARPHRAEGYRYYSTFSLWDTYRAAHPLYCLVQKPRVRDMVRTMLAMARENPDGTMPIWPLADDETHCMIGYHSAAVIAEAWAKGVRDFDLAEAFRLMKAQALKADYRGLGDVRPPRVRAGRRGSASRWRRPASTATTTGRSRRSRRPSAARRTPPSSRGAPPPSRTCSTGRRASRVRASRTARSRARSTRRGRASRRGGTTTPRATRGSTASPRSTTPRRTCGTSAAASPSRRGSTPSSRRRST